MDDTPIFLGYLAVKDNKISYIGKEIPEGKFDKEIECNGNLLMPSFKNAHAHDAMVFLRSKADDVSLQDWLFKVVFPKENQLTPDMCYYFSKLAFLEYISSGITASLDMYFYIDKVSEAARDFGFRRVAQFTYNMNRDSFESAIRKFDDYNNKKIYGDLVSLVLGIHAEYTIKDEELAETLNLVNTLKLPLYTHMAETKKEVEECKKIRRNGLSPVEFLDKYGLFKYGGVCFHSIYLSNEDIEIYKKNNISVVTCPGSNSKLASGVCPVQKYLDNNILVGIGTDGAASNNSLDMFKEMSLLSYLAKLKKEDPIAISAPSILKMATVNNARIMGLNNCDILEVGKLADIIEIDLSKPSMRPLANIENNLVYAGSKDLIKRTMINGKILYEEGKYLINEDVNHIYDVCQKYIDSLK